MKLVTNDFRITIKNSIANILTFLNLSLGCLSLLFMIKGEYLLASILIIIGTILDRFDGKIARKLETTSEFGKELDSLADLVSFGLAPSFLIWSLKLNEIVLFGSVISVIYILSGAFRLARYNCSEDHSIFLGIPITIAGALMAILSFAIILYDINIYLIAAIIIVLSYSMITTKIKIVKR